jgi:FkbM family methyltransferase
MYNSISYMVSLLPIKIQTFLSIIFFLIQAKYNKFYSSEAEWKILDTLISPGDLVIDIGANVGRYSLKMSKLVGQSGNVIAFEPNPRIFNILSSVLYNSGINNITLLNLGLSDMDGFFRLNESWNIPKIKHIFNTNTDSNLLKENGSILTIKLDNLNIQRKVSLIKIDIEGMELAACNGMINTLIKFRPKVIVENNDKSLIQFFDDLGYRLINNNNSRNMIFIYD